MLDIVSASGRISTIGILIQVLYCIALVEVKVDSCSRPLVLLEPNIALSTVVTIWGNVDSYHI